jgi:hypothetical protein
MRATKYKLKIKYMKNLMASFVLLLMMVMVGCGGSKESDGDKSGESVMQLNLAAPPVKASTAFSAPVREDAVVAETNVGYGQGAGAPMNEAGGDEKINVQKIDKKKIIKDGSLAVKTKDIVAAKKRFDAVLKKLNAYYETEYFEKQDYKMTYSLKIRIPSANFEKLITEVENGQDEMVAKSINARDVTEEYMDVEMRLNNKREYLKKYKEILSKAFTIKDILEVQENIRNLQEEIESKEGRLKYLNDQVAYSTLDVTLFKDIAYVYKPQQEDKFTERVKSALNSGWVAIVDFVLWLIKVWPQLLVILLLLLICKRIYKKRKANKK